MSTTSCCSVRSTTPDMWESVIECIVGSQTIAISGHTSPDGDALGSVLGLGQALIGAFPSKRIVLLLADDAPVPRIYRFLPGVERLVPARSYLEAPDLFISVDVPVMERLADSAAVAKRARARVVDRSTIPRARSLPTLPSASRRRRRRPSWSRSSCRPAAGR